MATPAFQAADQQQPTADGAATPVAAPSGAHQRERARPGRGLAPVEVGDDVAHRPGEGQRGQGRVDDVGHAVGSRVRAWPGRSGWSPRRGRGRRRVWCASMQRRQAVTPGHDERARGPHPRRPGVRRDGWCARADKGSSGRGRARRSPSTSTTSARGRPSRGDDDAQPVRSSRTEVGQAGELEPPRTADRRRMVRRVPVARGTRVASSRSSTDEAAGSSVDGPPLEEQATRALDAGGAGRAAPGGRRTGRSGGGRARA